MRTENAFPIDFGLGVEVDERGDLREEGPAIEGVDSLLRVDKESMQELTCSSTS